MVAEGFADEDCGELLVRYERLRKLGSGGQGEVYLIRDRSTGASYAGKMFANTNSGRWSMEVEVNMMRRLRFCPGVVTFKEAVTEKSGRCCGTIVMQVCGQTLLDRVLRDGPLREKDVAAIVLKLALAIKAMHSRRIVHRDLKLDNVFSKLDAKEPEDVVIGDFGLATFVGAELAYYSGTQRFIAPEMAVLENRGRGQAQTGAAYKGKAAIDLWGLGIIAYELLRGPRSESELNELRAGARPTGISQDAADAIHSLLAVDPCKRLTAQQLIQHPWITKFCGCGGVSVPVQVLFPRKRCRDVSVLALQQPSCKRAH